MNTKIVIAFVLAVGMIILGFLSFSGSLALAAGPEENVIFARVFLCLGQA